MAHWFASARFSIVHESHHSLRLVAFVKFSRMASEKLRLCECILLFFFLFKKFYFFLERRPSWQIAQANSPQMANGNRVGTEKRQGYRSFLSAKKKKKKTDSGELENKNETDRNAKGEAIVFLFSFSFTFLSGIAGDFPASIWNTFEEKR